MNVQIQQNSINGVIMTDSPCYENKDGLAITIPPDSKNGYAITHIRTGKAVFDFVPTYRLAKKILNELTENISWDISRDVLLGNGAADKAFELRQKYEL